MYIFCKACSHKKSSLSSSCPHILLFTPYSPVCAAVWAAVLRKRSSHCLMRVSGKGSRPWHQCLAQYRLVCSAVLARYCLGHVAPGLDHLHQHSCGEACYWTHMQVSGAKTRVCF